MTEHAHMIEDDDGNMVPEPPEMKRARELHEAYHARFGEWAPCFGVVYEDEAEELDAIERAIKTGQPIVLDLPPGCDA